MGTEELELMRHKTKLTLKKLHHAQIHAKYRQKLAAKAVGEAIKRLHNNHLMVHSRHITGSGLIKFLPAEAVSIYQKAQRRLLKATKVVLEQRKMINSLKDLREKL